MERERHVPNSILECALTASRLAMPLAPHTGREESLLIDYLRACAERNAAIRERDALRAEVETLRARVA